MAIPGSVVQYEDGVQYFGVSWFRDLGNVPQSFANQFILFKLLGVNYFCDIWIDGQYVGYHEGGFTCFAFDVSQLLTRAIILLQFALTILHGIPVIFNIKLFPMGAISSIMVAL